MKNSENPKTGENNVQHELTRRTFSDFAILLPTIIIQGISGLLTASVLTKLFPPEQYGNFVLAHGIFLFLGILTGVWVETSVIRLIPEYKSKNLHDQLTSTLIISAATIWISIAACSSLILFILKGLIDIQLLPLLVIALFGSGFMTSLCFIESLSRINGYSLRYCTVVIVRVSGGLGFGLLFSIVFKLGIVGYFFGLILPIALMSLFFAWKKRTFFLKLFFSWTFASEDLKAALHYSLPIVGLNIMAIILTISDRYIIRGHLNAYDVGIYSIGYVIANQGMLLVITVLMTVSSPIAVRTWEEYGSTETISYLNKLLQFYSIMAIPAMVGLFLLSHELIILFAKVEYAAAAPVIGFVGLAILFHGYTQVLNIVFSLKKKTIIQFRNFVLPTVLNIFLNLMLIPRFGYMAAAWSTLISYMILFIITLFATRRLMKFKLINRSVWKVFISTTGMGLVVYFCKSIFNSMILNLFLSIALGILSYFILILLLNNIRTTKMFKQFLGLEPEVLNY